MIKAMWLLAVLLLTRRLVADELEAVAPEAACL
jgi:hypothetical protein